MTIKGKKNLTFMQHRLLFISSGPLLLQVSTHQLSHLPSDPNHCNTKIPFCQKDSTKLLTCPLLLF